MRTIALMVLLAILTSGCSVKNQQKGQYDELFSDKGEWIPINSQKIQQEENK